MNKLNSDPTQTPSMTPNPNHNPTNPNSNPSQPNHICKQKKYRDEKLGKHGVCASFVEGRRGKQRKSSEETREKKELIEVKGRR